MSNGLNVVHLDYEQRSSNGSKNSGKVFVTIGLEEFAVHSKDGDDSDNQWFRLTKARSDLSPREIMDQYEERLRDEYGIVPDVVDLSFHDSQNPNVPCRVGFSNPSCRKRRKIYGCFRDLVVSLPRYD